MNPRNFDLIAFDWDGTLFDSTKIIVRCIQAAVVDVGGKRPSGEAAGYVIGLGLMQALARAAPDVPPEKYPELGARYRHHYALHADDLALFAQQPDGDDKAGSPDTKIKTNTSPGTGAHGDHGGKP